MPLDTKTSVVEVISSDEAQQKSEIRSIPFGRPMIGDAERAAVMDVLSGHILTHGPKVKEFETAFAEFTGAPHALATSSCMAALHLAYMYLGIGCDDEVIVPAQTHVATAHAVELCGARSVFVDCESQTGNIDIDQIEAAITEKTKALSVVHYLGLPVDMPRIMQIANKHNLFVVEDCALAIGATVQGTHVGLFGDVGCFSFYPVKHITTAEGGMLITRRDDVAEAVSMLRAFGIDRNIVSQRPIPGEYDVQVLGNNYRMNELGAAMGLVQVGRLDEFLAKRRANYEQLEAGLSDIQGIKLLNSTTGPLQSAYYCFTILLGEGLEPKRRAMMDLLKQRGVGCSVYYPRPVPNMSYYRQRYGSADKCFPVASRFSATSIALPVGPHVGKKDVQYIVASVKTAIATVR
ncbi:MAG: DegT/DnrJ/EryC1/StrS family aminotransferase [Planctomycetes bacterium]|nr:DegT/DnrJ/EryC1/StrS family aminotransferase [Planctomycetota bacterium]